MTITMLKAEQNLINVTVKTELMQQVLKNET